MSVIKYESTEFVWKYEQERSFRLYLEPYTQSYLLSKVSWSTRHPVCVNFNVLPEYREEVLTHEFDVSEFLKKDILITRWLKSDSKKIEEMCKIDQQIAHTTLDMSHIPHGINLEFKYQCRHEEIKIRVEYPVLYYTYDGKLFPRFTR